MIRASNELNAAYRDLDAKMRDAFIRDYRRTFEAIPSSDELHASPLPDAPIGPCYGELLQDQPE